MGSISNHCEDVANWIEKVINSCKTPQQEIVARNLVQLFENQLVKKERDLCIYYMSHFNKALNNLELKKKS
jgi:hypothetical protein